MNLGIIFNVIRLKPKSSSLKWKGAWLRYKQPSVHAQAFICTIYYGGEGPLNVFTGTACTCSIMESSGRTDHFPGRSCVT